MGPRFEVLCRQFIRLHAERFGRPIGDLGVWWKADDELDIVGHEGRTVTLAAEVKWTNEPVGMDTLRTLQRRAALLPTVADDAQLALFSKSGFTSAVQAAATPYLLLFALDDLLP